jgi:hypothetical protein
MQRDFKKESKMERMPFNTAKLQTAPKRYDVFLHDMWLGETEAVSPERAISNVLWTHNLYGILTRSEIEQLRTEEVA